MGIEAIVQNGISLLRENRIASDRIKDAHRQFPTNISHYLMGFEQYAKNIRENVTYPFKHPKKSLNFIINDLKGKYLALGSLVAANTADAITTVMDVNKYDVSGETSSLIRWFMETYGPITGISLHRGISLPVIIGVSYAAGKAFNYLYEKNRNSRGVAINEKFGKILENAPIHLAAVPFYIATANNLYQFLK